MAPSPRAACSRRSAADPALRDRSAAAGQDRRRVATRATAAFRRCSVRRTLPIFISGLDRLEHRQQSSATTASDYLSENSRNCALFTHDIIHITDGLDLTLGLRYTNESKELDAALRQQQHRLPEAQALDPAAAEHSRAGTATQTALLGGIVGLACQGNSTAELNASDAQRQSRARTSSPAPRSFRTR